MQGEAGTRDVLMLVGKKLFRAQEKNRQAAYLSRLAGLHLALDLWRSKASGRAPRTSLQTSQTTVGFTAIRVQLVSWWRSLSLSRE